jgi:hypothetical protein
MAMLGLRGKRAHRVSRVFKVKLDLPDLLDQVAKPELQVQLGKPDHKVSKVNPE